MDVRDIMEDDDIQGRRGQFNPFRCTPPSTSVSPSAWPDYMPHSPFLPSPVVSVPTGLNLPGKVNGTTEQLEAENFHHSLGVCLKEQPSSLIQFSSHFVGDINAGNFAHSLYRDIENCSNDPMCNAGSQSIPPDFMHSDFLSYQHEMRLDAYISPDIETFGSNRFYKNDEDTVQESGSSERKAVIDNLFGNWTPTSTGTYSPFGSNVESAEKKSEHDIEHKNLKQKPPKLSYSDVLTKAPASAKQATGLSQSLKGENSTVNLRGVAGRAKVQHNIGLKRQYSSGSDEQNSFGNMPKFGSDPDFSLSGTDIISGGTSNRENVVYTSQKQMPLDCMGNSRCGKMAGGGGLEEISLTQMPKHCSDHIQDKTLPNSSGSYSDVFVNKESVLKSVEKSKSENLLYARSHQFLSQNQSPSQSSVQNQNLSDSLTESHSQSTVGTTLQKSSRQKDYSCLEDKVNQTILNNDKATYNSQQKASQKRPLHINNNLGTSTWQASEKNLNKPSANSGRIKNCKVSCEGEQDVEEGNISEQNVSKNSDKGDIQAPCKSSHLSNQSGTSHFEKLGKERELPVKKGSRSKKKEQNGPSFGIISEQNISKKCDKGDPQAQAHSVPCKSSHFINQNGTSNSEKLEKEKELPVRKGPKSRKKEQDGPSFEYCQELGLQLQKWMLISFQGILWLLHLLYDVSSMSAKLLLQLSQVIWEWGRQKAVYYCQMTWQKLKIKSLFWKGRETENEPSFLNCKTNGGWGDLEYNISLPATGEEAMKRLLACRGKDPYSILGVTSTCTDDDIKKYYRRQAFLVHPDKNHQPGAEEAFKILAHAFELIGKPERRSDYNKMIEAQQMEQAQAWNEVTNLLIKLHEKMEEAANTIRCTNCHNRHRRNKTDRPCYAARFCSQCKTHHAAREGDIWAESSVLGFLWHYYACMDGAVYDITEWADCQSQNLKHLQANTHNVQYRIGLGKRHSHRNRQQQPEYPSEPDLDDFLNNLYSQSVNGDSPPGGAKQQQQQHNETAGVRRRKGRKKNR